jgi:short subunit dehydrogenase-like uncharacterized protein
MNCLIVGAESTPMSDNPFDVIVFGATSFAGQILCDYLFKRHGADGDLKWAMAGRSKTKLESVRASLGEGASGIELITADAADENAPVPIAGARCG